MKILSILSPLKTLALLAAFSFSSLSFAGVEVQTDENNVTLAGYDAVAYFTENAPVEGDSNISTVHNGAIYHFSSVANRDTFNANPEKYAPQFGGYCAYGTSLGKKFAVNGKAFELIDGKLYVQKSEVVQEVWSENTQANLAAANANWPKIKGIAADKL
ncbi:YHS domain-containing (seleno)protein [Amphritea japonica]|uniref:YHS domain-containing protein n=1 Tax=Amphritea japonica ATCC BAA-1530 TaxID=1278309 RepID=A0A7R6PCL4_9GAMM|nr:YHS domain-containing (seleno)protein [Amphritea japonica]BBB26933.1 conserved hypothetical protein [Amphritea japonica ATCC BAA-1530]